MQTAKVARLATSDRDQPHLVPVVFVFDGRHIYIPIDEKKKKTYLPEELKRIKNIRKNPNVAFLIDRYDDDWTKLYFMMIIGKASIILPIESCRKEFERLIVKKYPQYQTINYGTTCIKIKPEKITFWQNS